MLASTVMVRVSAVDPAGNRAVRAGICNRDPIHPGRIIVGTSGVIINPEALPSLYSYVRRRMPPEILAQAGRKGCLGAFVICPAATTIAPFLKDPPGSSSPNATFEHYSSRWLFPPVKDETIIDVLAELPESLSTTPKPKGSPELDNEQQQQQQEEQAGLTGNRGDIILDWHQAYVVAVGIAEAVPPALSMLLSGSSGNWSAGWPVIGSRASVIPPDDAAKLALLFVPDLRIECQATLTKGGGTDTFAITQSRLYLHTSTGAKRWHIPNFSSAATTYETRRASRHRSSMYHAQRPYFNPAEQILRPSGAEWVFERGLYVVSTPYGTLLPVTFHRSVSKASITNAIGIVRPVHALPDPESGRLHETPALYIIDGRCLPGMEGGAMYTHDGIFVGMVTLPLCECGWSTRVLPYNALREAGNSEHTPASGPAVDPSQPALAQYLRKYENQQAALNAKLNEWNRSANRQAIEETNQAPVSALLTTPSFGAHINLVITAPALAQWLTSIIALCEAEIREHAHAMDETERNGHSHNYSPRMHLSLLAASAPTSLSSLSSPIQQHALARASRFASQFFSGTMRGAEGTQAANHSSSIFRQDTGAGQSVGSRASETLRSVGTLSSFGRHSALQLRRSVVVIRAQGSWAAGVVISSNGYILTSAHLIRPLIKTQLPQRSDGHTGEPHSPQKSHGMPPENVSSISDFINWLGNPELQRLFSPELRNHAKIQVRIDPEAWYSAPPAPRRDRYSPQAHAQVWRSPGGTSHPDTSNTLYFDANLVYISSGIVDVALLKLDLPTRHALCAAKLPDLASVHSMWSGLDPGTNICVIGHPLFCPTVPIRPSITRGIVTRVVAKSAKLPAPEEVGVRPRSHSETIFQVAIMLQTDATVYSGNSGGGVFDVDRGTLLGLVTCNSFHHGELFPPNLYFIQEHVPTDSSRSHQARTDADDALHIPDTLVKTLLPVLNFSIPVAVLYPLIAFVQSKPFPIFLAQALLGRPLHGSGKESYLPPAAWLWAFTKMQSGNAATNSYHPEKRIAHSVIHDVEEFQQTIAKYWSLADISSVSNVIFMRKQPLHTGSLVNPPRPGPLTPDTLRRFNEYRQRIRDLSNPTELPFSEKFKQVKRALELEQEEKMIRAQPQKYEG